MIHTKTIVVFRSDYQIFHVCISGQASDGIGVKFYRIEIICEARVFFPGNLCHVLDPFGNIGPLHFFHGPTLPYSGWYRIQTPVNEHSEFSLIKPFNAFMLFRMHFVPFLYHIDGRIIVTCLNYKWNQEEIKKYFISDQHSFICFINR